MTFENQEANFNAMNRTFADKVNSIFTSQDLNSICNVSMDGVMLSDDDTQMDDLYEMNTPEEDIDAIGEDGGA